jgi:hypothetical protein
MDLKCVEKRLISSWQKDREIKRGNEAGAEEIGTEEDPVEGHLLETQDEAKKEIEIQDPEKDIPESVNITYLRNIDLEIYL